MATKINIENLMPGSEAWWHQKSAVNHPKRAVAPTTVQTPDDVKRQQLADMRQPNPQMPTRTRGGGYRQPGVSENELNDFMAQGNGEVVDLTGTNEMNKSQAQKIGEQRAGGVLPEQNTKPVADRHQRTAIEVNDEGGSTAATQGTGTTYNGYDDILKLMRHNAVSGAELARRQRSREIVAGLGDTISAIANMWATTKGAPNSYDNSKGMSATAQERYAKMLAERKAQQEQILNYYRVKKAAEQEAETRKYREDMMRWRNQNSAGKAESRENANEVARAKNPHLAEYDAAFKDEYNTKYPQYIAEGKSPEEADALATEDANIAGDNAYIASVNRARTQAEQKADDAHGLNEERQKTEKAKQNKYNQPKGSGVGSSNSKKGKQKKKKVAPKRKVRQNASSQSQSSGGNTMPGVK